MSKLKTAYLVLDDGRIFEGSSWAKTGETFGEAVFSSPPPAPMTGAFFRLFSSEEASQLAPPCFI